MDTGHLGSFQILLTAEALGNPQATDLCETLADLRMWTACKVTRTGMLVGGVLIE